MKVALLGTAPGSRLMAPFEDKSYEIWACSAGNSQAAALPRVDKWFEIHALCDMLGAENKAWSIPYYKWLREQTFPIYMQEPNEMVPQAITFPYKELTARFGPNPRKGKANWFTSSIAWMWAFALTMMKKGDEVAIFGVDMAAAEEAYTAQKAGLHRFTEYSYEMGVNVTIPFESCLGKTLPLYGYSEATPMGRKWMVRLHEMQSHRAALDAQIQNLIQQRAFFDGALETVRYDIRTWTDGMDADIIMNKEQKMTDDMIVKDALRPIAERMTPVPLTREFTENAAGVFVPQGMGKNPPALPEGSSVTVRPDGKKDYTMRADMGRIGAQGNAPNGKGE